MQQDMLETPLHLIPFPGADAKKQKKIIPDLNLEVDQPIHYTQHIVQQHPIHWRK